MRRLALATVFLLSLSGCGARHRAAAAPVVACDAGDATYYADGLAGRKTSSGELYDPSRLTAAHRRLPLGSKVRVVVGGREVIVRVNDRGPSRHDGVIDLSRAAAQELGIVKAGRVRVLVCPA